MTGQRPQPSARQPGIEALERDGDGCRYVLWTPEGRVSGWLKCKTMQAARETLDRQLREYLGRIDFRPRRNRRKVPLYNRGRAAEERA